MSLFTCLPHFQSDGFLITLAPTPSIMALFRGPFELVVFRLILEVVVIDGCCLEVDATDELSISLSCDIFITKNNDDFWYHSILKTTNHN